MAYSTILNLLLIIINKEKTHFSIIKTKIIKLKNYQLNKTIRNQRLNLN